MFGGQRMDAYGSTTMGENGQVVLPIKIRKKFKIKAGDKFLVLGGEHTPQAWGIILVKGDVLSKIVSKLFGGQLKEMLANEK